MPKYHLFQCQGGSLSNNIMELSVNALQSTKDLGVNAIFVIEISRAFDPKFYKKNGFEKPITLRESYSFLNEGVTTS